MVHWCLQVLGLLRVPLAACLSPQPSGLWPIREPAAALEEVVW